jgi:hypothetical protein
VKDIDDKALANEPASHGLRETLLVLDNQYAHVLILQLLARRSQLMVS